MQKLTLIAAYAAKSNQGKGFSAVLERYNHVKVQLDPGCIAATCLHILFTNIKRDLDIDSLIVSFRVLTTLKAKNSNGEGVPHNSCCSKPSSDFVSRVREPILGGDLRSKL